MTALVLFIILSAVVYRVSRFIMLDDLIKGSRDWFFARLMKARKDGSVALWRSKLAELLDCPWCLTVWVAGAVVAIHHFAVDPLPFPLWWVPALSGGALVFWSVIED